MIPYYYTNFLKDTTFEFYEQWRLNISGDEPNKNLIFSHVIHLYKAQISTLVFEFK